MFGCHISGGSNNAAFFTPRKSDIKGGFISPVDGGNHPDPFGCPADTAPAVAEHVVKLHDRRHLQIHTEIRRQHRTLVGEFFNVVVRVLPDPLKTIVIKEEMNHAVKVILILQMGLVKTDQ